MSGATCAIAVRDFKGLFGTPLGWIAACIIFLVSGIVFFIVVQMLLIRGQAMDPVADIWGQIVGFLNYINLFIIPAFTMKTMSDELGSGLFRLQAAAPISAWSIILGKFFGIMLYFAFISASMLIYPLFTVIFTTPDLSVMFCGYFGFLLNTAVIAAASLFIGTLTKSPVLSYLGSTFGLILLIFCSFIPGMPEWFKSSMNILELGSSFTQGVLKTGSVAIFVCMIVLFLTLGRFVLDSKKWRV